jgi:hypothetical protein
MLDAALVRYHPGVYDDSLDGLSSADQALTEETLAGLRLVRNRVGEPDDLIGFVDSGTTDVEPLAWRITGWRWKAVPARSPGSRSKSAQAWDLARYRAYQNCLAGTAIGDTFDCCTTFLLATATRAMAVTPMDASVTR